MTAELYVSPKAYITLSYWVTGCQYVTLIEALGLILLTRLFSNCVLVETLHGCQDWLCPTFNALGLIAI